MTLLDDQVEPDQLLARLRSLRERRRDLGLAACLLALAGGALIVVNRSEVAVPTLFAAAVGVTAVWLLTLERTQVLTRLIAGRVGTELEEVRPFARELCSEARRRRFAEGLERAARAGRPGLHELTHIRPERAYTVGGRLDELAAAFRDMSRTLDPSSAALCRRLLTEAARSPLYNAAVPEQELVRILETIATGFDRRP